RGPDRGRPALRAPAGAAEALGAAERPAHHPLRRRRAAGPAHRARRPGQPGAEGPRQPRTPRAQVAPPGPRSGDRVIEITDLTVRFGGVTPLDRVSLKFPPGTCGLIGPNGAGKTTFFNVLSGFVSPLAGGVRAFGDDL